MSHASRLRLSPDISLSPLLRTARWITHGLQAVSLELQRREAIRALGASEDRMLADIGIARGGVEDAVRRGRR